MMGAASLTALVFLDGRRESGVRHTRHSHLVGAGIPLGAPAPIWTCHCAWRSARKTTRTAVVRLSLTKFARQISLINNPCGPAETNRIKEKPSRAMTSVHLRRALYPERKNYKRNKEYSPGQPSAKDSRSPTLVFFLLPKNRSQRPNLAFGQCCVLSTRG